MENPVNPADDKTPEQIQDEMAQTRASLTEKVATLEDQVLGTAKTAAATLTDTVEAVKSLVEKAPDMAKRAASAVTETVKGALDISGHVRSNPWAAVGVSAGAGFLTGLLVFRPREHELNGVAPVPAAAYAPPAAGPSKPGVFDELFAMIGRKLREVAENVIDSAGSALNQNVRAGVPKLVDAATEMAAERLTPATGHPRPGVYSG